MGAAWQGARRPLRAGARGAAGGRPGTAVVGGEQGHFARPSRSAGAPEETTRAYLFTAVGSAVARPG